MSEKKTRIDKARVVFNSLNNVENIIRLNNSNVISVLHYGGEWCSTVITKTNKQNTFYNGCFKEFTKFFYQTMN